MGTDTKPKLGTTFHSGQTSPVTGIFTRVVHEQEHGHVISVREGAVFPGFEGGPVDWQLIQYDDTSEPMNR